MHLAIVMLMYKLLEYSENYFEDEVSDDSNENNDSVNYRVNNQQGNNKQIFWVEDKNNRKHTSW